MKTPKTTMELLAPARGLEQLEYALHYGADAIYVGGERFGLRQRAQNFSIEDIALGAQKVHAVNKMLFVTVNAIMHEEDLAPLYSYLEQIHAAGVDAIIVSDLAALKAAQKYAPSAEIHVSTQASVANSETAKAWRDLGATRVVLARELSLTEIAQIKKAVKDTIELEVFVHGAMCMAYSGRCLISSYLTGRDANRGHCTQPCRWKYSLVEETRPTQQFPVETSNHGTFIMNSKDLMMLEHLDKLRDAGVNSIKIEGRMKGSYYVATVVNAYRQVLDGTPARDFLAHMDSVSHRPYSTGFFFGEASQAPDESDYEQTHLLVADVLSCSEGRVVVNLRNRIEEGEIIEVLSPGAPVRALKVSNIKDRRGEPCVVASNNMQSYSFDAPFELATMDIVRKEIAQTAITAAVTAALVAAPVATPIATPAAEQTASQAATESAVQDQGV